MRRPTESFNVPEKPAQDRAISVTHDGETYAVHVRRVRTARRFILRVRSATRDAVLTMPGRAALKDAADFAERNAAWLGVRLRRLPENVPFEEGAIFPLRGAPTRIVATGSLRGVVMEDRDENDAPILRVGGAPEHIARRVRDFLKEEARLALQGAVDAYAAKIGKPAPRVTLRDTTSRWGSCSTSGALNFSWRLIMAPPYVLDYLAAHEVCHLQHMNHSRRFWDLCARLCPRTDEAEAWLTAHGVSLHRYGPAKAG
jgi:hypothetical protein